MRHVGELEKMHWGSRQHTTGPGRDTCPGQVARRNSRYLDRQVAHDKGRGRSLQAPFRPRAEALLWRMLGAVWHQHLSLVPGRQLLHHLRRPVSACGAGAVGSVAGERQRVVTPLTKMVTAFSGMVPPALPTACPRVLRGPVLYLYLYSTVV